MSAMGQKRTSRRLFDHLIGTVLHRLRHGNAERLGGLEVDEQLDFRDLLDGQISRLVAPKYSSGKDAKIGVGQGGAGLSRLGVGATRATSRKMPCLGSSMLRPALQAEEPAAREPGEGTGR